MKIDEDENRTLIRLEEYNVASDKQNSDQVIDISRRIAQTAGESVQFFIMNMAGRLNCPMHLLQLQRFTMEIIQS